MKCESPSLQEELLGEARGGPVRTTAYVEHLAGCLDCRDAVAFLERAREHQRPDLSSEELAALRLRVLPRLSWQQRPVGRLRLPGLSLGFAVGMGAALSLAAGGSYLVWQSAGQHEVAVTRPVSRQVASRPAVPAPAPAVTETPAVPAPVEAESPVGRSDDLGVKSASAPKAAASGLWSDAASALKNDDLPRAERALGQLVGDPDSVTRDSAQLALAEIWMKNQQVPRARTALQRLARSGSTPAIRQRAARLLAELPR
jgi:hypothetical protein